MRQHGLGWSITILDLHQQQFLLRPSIVAALDILWQTWLALLLVQATAYILLPPFINVRARHVAGSDGVNSLAPWHALTA